MSDLQQTLIIGSGPAGLTAALYLARFGLAPTVLTGKIAGGQPIWTGIVDNYPGFPEGTTGPLLTQKFVEQATKFGATLAPEIATRVDFTNSPFQVWTTNDVSELPNYTARSVIIATGSTPKPLGLAEEAQFMGKGLALCAICDGPFYKNKTVAVVGSGNKAMEEALLLTQYAAKVFLLVRGQQLKGETCLQRQIAENQKIETIFSQRVIKLVGEQHLEKIVLQNSLAPTETQELAVAGLFLAIGQIPESALFQNQIKLDDHGQILTGYQLHLEKTPFVSATSINGIFAAGDIVAGSYQQIATAVGSGATAALDVREFLSQENIN